VVLEKDGEDQLDRSCQKNEPLLRVEKAGNILHTIQRWKTNWISYILRRICLLKHAIWGKEEDKKRRSRRREPLLDCFKEKRRHRK